MAERVSPAQRVRMQHVAEREIQRYADDHAAWHKHVHDVELDPMQILKCIEMDRETNTIDFSCRRTGKTAVKELYGLKWNACNADQEWGIVAPREAQSLNNLSYHLEAIRRSPILPHFIAWKGGRKRMNDTQYELANRSRAVAYGIMAQVDGGDLTAASLEETDDMPADRLYSNFLLMLGATRRLGASPDAVNEPQIRITGVFKGADTLQGLLSSGSYYALPTVDGYLGIEMGILNEQFLMDMREQLSPDEYLRQILCKNVSARNLVWEKYVRLALQVGLAAGLEPAPPIPGAQYGRRGLVSFGYDAGGHGENPQSSRHALVVTEQLGNWITFPFVRQWPAGADDTTVKDDLKAAWRYFRPDVAHGDAYGVGMLTQLNDELFREGLTDIDRRTIGEGDSTASTWPEWAFSPIRFEGMQKHQMAQAVRAVFHKGHAAIPYVEDREDPETADFRALTRQIPNIKPVETGKSYSSYQMADRKLGDDLFDATMASIWGHVTRGAPAVAGEIHRRTQSREALLGQRPARLPSATP